MIKSHSSSLRAQTFLEEVLDEFDASDPEEALHLLRRMKDLLSQYYQDRKTLQSLGLDDLDDALNAMMAMRHRVETMQEQLDAYQEVQKKLHAIQDALDVSADAEETVNTIANISKQLEAIYEERETLSRAGLSDASEAVDLIQSMQEQLDQLNEAPESPPKAGDKEDAFALLERELGVSDPESVIQMVESMEEQLSASVDDANDAVSEDPSSDESPSPPSPGSSPTAVHTLQRQLLALQEGDVELPTDEFATLLPFETLRQLDEQASGALNQYSVGIFAVNDDDCIQAANTHHPPLPGLEDDAIGASFFERVPASRNPLLQLPLQTARQNGVLDARFFYTFPQPQHKGSPLSVKLQFHRTKQNSVTWLLYSPL